ncbi:MAG TPA: chemotaxis protein MotB, partial [Geobacteraceae bacterium]|nr:chemotaxis protein MotB [Geobacteraceae bacterium]
MLRKMQLMAVLLGLSWAIGGCVSMGKYDLKDKEACDISKTLQEMQQKNADLTRENTDLKVQFEKLNGNVAGLTKERENLTADNRKLEDLLKAKTDELSSNVRELRQKSADLENENARFKGDIANLQKARVEEVQKTSNTYEEMLEKMKNEISQGQVTISELKGKLTVNMVDAILFDSGMAEVKPAGLAVLQKVIDILKTVKEKAIRIEGHTDNVQISGALTRKYPTNWELSA